MSKRPCGSASDIEFEIGCGFAGHEDQKNESEHENNRLYKYGSRSGWVIEHKTKGLGLL